MNITFAFLVFGPYLVRPDKAQSQGGGKYSKLISL